LCVISQQIVVFRSICDECNLSGFEISCLDLKLLLSFLDLQCLLRFSSIAFLELSCSLVARDPLLFGFLGEVFNPGVELALANALDLLVVSRLLSDNVLSESSLYLKAVAVDFLCEINNA